MPVVFDFVVLIKLVQLTRLFVSFVLVKLLFSAIYWVELRYITFPVYSVAYILPKLSSVTLKTIITANKILMLILPPPGPKTAPTKFRTLKNLFYQIL